MNFLQQAWPEERLAMAFRELMRLRVLFLMLKGSCYAIFWAQITLRANIRIDMMEGLRRMILNIRESKLWFR